MAKATFSDLYDNNVEALAAAYPPINKKDPYDRSSADFALANHFLFWSGKDHDRVRTLMKTSALARKKWVSHKTYLATTIIRASARCENTYTGKKKKDPPVVMDEVPTGKIDSITPAATVGSQFMSAPQQLEYFKNCVYVTLADRILVPNGDLLKPAQFKSSRAGYTFALDGMNEKTTTNAADAFINNQAYKFPKVDLTCFRPDLKPYEIITDEEHLLVNTYVPIHVPRSQGDPAPFLNHMHKLFPLDSDYDIIMSYLASLVQFQGVKFQWCPIIQGAEGNGKTLIGKVLANAVGWRYSHFPNAQALGDGGLKFNGWLLGKLLVFIEEIYTSDKRQLTEPLKVIITNNKIEIQFKGQDQFLGDNLANVVMCSNHKDCMKITYDTRRYWMYFCPQQGVRDMIRDGMVGEYFSKIYNWLDHGGYAICSEYLFTYPISEEFRAQLLKRAPGSSSLHESVSISRGPVEQHILEAIEEERPGFRNGYVSSKTLNDLLIEIKMDGKITPYRRQEIMESLGYMKHPWLRDGRTNNPVDAEGAKIRIYSNLDFTGIEQASAAVTKTMYESAQEYTVKPLEVVK